MLDFLLRIRWPRVRGYFLSKIPKFRIPKTRIPKSRHCERSEAISRNSRFYLKFPTMSSSGLTRGSHHIAVIAEIPSLRGAKRPKQSLGILEFSPELEFLGILEFLGFKLS